MTLDLSLPMLMMTMHLHRINFCENTNSQKQIGNCSMFATENRQMQMEFVSFLFFTLLKSFFNQIKSVGFESLVRIQLQSNISHNLGVHCTKKCKYTVHTFQFYQDLKHSISVIHKIIFLTFCQIRQ